MRFLAILKAGLAPGLLVLALAGAPLAQTPQFAPAEESPEDLPEGPGREETFYACTACHAFRLVASQGLSRQHWHDTLDLMTSRHNMPEITGAERELILDYLEKHYPPRATGRGGWRNPFAPQ
ncbi:MAG TPA: hypothetical protein VM434_08130 [Beijerinckiaceae bacterium]|nr:hypothetical protein [Beijerinckiaceae bacterium]